MASPIPYDLRRQIISLRKSGSTYSCISKELGYSVNGIKKIWYQYQKEGDACLTTRYHTCGRKSDFPQAVHDAIAQIRTGDQGASYVYSMLKIRYPHLKRPSIRTIQTWWKKSLTNRPKGRPEKSEKKSGQTKVMTLGK